MSTKKKEVKPQPEDVILTDLLRQRLQQLTFMEEYKARFFAAKGAVEMLDTLIAERRNGKEDKNV